MSDTFWGEMITASNSLMSHQLGHIGMLQELEYGYPGSKPIYDLDLIYSIVSIHLYILICL